MTRLCIATIILNTLFHTTFTFERPFNNAQYIRSKIVDGTIFLNCKIGANDKIFKIINPSDRVYGYCYKVSSGSRWMCVGPIIQHGGSNRMNVQVKIRISKENCGEWKCAHSRKPDIVDTRSEEKLCNILKDVERKPVFKCVALVNNRLKSVFEFSGIFVQPLDNTVTILVNYTTVDILRFYNNTCYIQNRACTGENDICWCNTIGNVFKMKYILDKTGSFYINTMIGVQMLLKANNGKVVQMTLLRIYDGKEFGELKIEMDSNAHVNIPNKDVINGMGVFMFLLFILVALIAIIVCWIALTVLAKCRGSFKDTKCQ
ncbi:uncharacterized protein LOC143059212 [Mytilus galloprovincialis]|uniref:uncharacterized protein LOC143059212 n=1 Tax=Mytilus galloprovincialis TaxID=29158 RepID=UPI003F7C8FDD